MSNKHKICTKPKDFLGTNKVFIVLNETKEKIIFSLKKKTKINIIKHKRAFEIVNRYKIT